MFGKLLKYDFEAMAKSLLPIYLLMIVASLITNLLLMTKYNTPSIIATAAFSAICVAAVVITLVTTVRRFRHNLLKDEGYLMFTLPVSSTQLILSKAVAALIWGIIGTCCGILSGLLFLVNVGSIDWKSFGDALSWIFATASAGDWVLLLEIFIAGLLNYGLFLFAIYLSISVAQLPLFKNNHGFLKKITPLLCFILFYVVYVSICNLLANIIPIDTVIASTNQLLLPVLESIGIELAVVAILFCLVNYILSRHLNLE